MDQTYTMRKSTPKSSVSSKYDIKEVEEEEAALLPPIDGGRRA
jgi:hypothetical protein